MIDSTQLTTNDDLENLLERIQHRVTRNFCVFYFFLALFAIPPSFLAGDSLTSLINCILAALYFIPFILVLTTSKHKLAAKTIVIVSMLSLTINGVISNMDVSIVTIGWYFIFLLFSHLMLGMKWARFVAAFSLSIISLFVILRLLDLHQINPLFIERNKLIGIPFVTGIAYIALLYLLTTYKTINDIVIREILQSNKEKNQIVSMMSHDLRNSLGAIQNVTSFINDDLKKSTIDSDALARKISLIDKAATTGLDMVEEIVSSTRNQVDKQLDIKTITSSALLAPLIERYKTTAEQKGVSLKLADDFKYISLQVDIEKISRVMENLISNAIKFCNQGDSITISIRKQKKKVVIQVTDTGIGIPLDLQHDIFEPFNKARRQGTASEKSIGLGMSIIKKLIDIHHGKISLESYPGEGTTVTIKLPVLSAI